MQELLQRLQRIDHFIRIRGTGSPAQLAEKLGIGERTLYEYLSVMKRYGAPIKFCRERKSYYYDETGQFHVSFFCKESAN